MRITVQYLDYLAHIDKSDVLVMPTRAFDLIRGLLWFHKQNLDIDWARLTPCDHRVRVERRNNTDDYHSGIQGFRSWKWKRQDKLLGRGSGIQTLGATAFDDLLTSNEVVVAFTRQTGECIGLLGATLEGITLVSPGENTDPSAGRHEQRAAAGVAAEEPLQGSTGMTAISSPRPGGSDRTAGLGSCVGEPLMTRPPGYSLPPLPSFLESLANIDGAVRR